MPRPGAVGTGHVTVVLADEGTHEVLAGGVLGLVVFQEAVRSAKAGPRPGGLSGWALRRCRVAASAMPVWKQWGTSAISLPRISSPKRHMPVMPPAETTSGWTTSHAAASQPAVKSFDCAELLAASDGDGRGEVPGAPCGPEW